ncbi:MAG: SRPBCC family protein [Ornithinimicrobium sp.]
MGHLTVHARGPLPAEAVWERYAVPARWHTWAPHISSVEYAEARLAQGARGRVLGPLGATATFVIDSVDEPSQTWAWTVTVPVGGTSLMSVKLHHDVRSRGEGSWTSLRLGGPVIVIAGYAPIAWYALRRLTR